MVIMMYDAIIIGSGPAGYKCAERVSELGGKAAVIEKGEIGGTCINYGCIPTKAFHASASFAADVKKAHRIGFDATEISAKMSLLVERKDRIVKAMSLGVKKILSDSGVEFIQGEAEIRDRNTVLANGRELKAKSIVIATGAKPIVPEGVEISDIAMTSREILHMKEMPSSMIIIGGGYIGCEFASIFSAFGVKVAVLEAMPRIMVHMDAEISEELAKCLRKQGAEIFTESKLLGIDGNRVVHSHENKIKEIEAEKILIAVGLEPSFSRREMDGLGVKYGRGIFADKKMRTNVENIYAIGDVTDQIKLAHYACAQAEIAARNIMGMGCEFDGSVVPSAIFTLPEISSVGVCSPELKSAKFPFAANGKARAMGAAEGFVKVFYEGGALRGFCAIGPHATDLVSEAALAIKNNISMEKIRDTIHAHPTLSEAFAGAIGIALKSGKTH